VTHRRQYAENTSTAERVFTALSVKHDKQLSYNVTLWRVRVTFIPPQLHNISIEESVVMVIYVADNKKPYLGLHVNCPTFLSNFNQTLIFSTD
jgi:hypothetical protein